MGRQFQPTFNNKSRITSVSIVSIKYNLAHVKLYNTQVNLKLNLQQEHKFALIKQTRVHIKYPSLC